MLRWKMKRAMQRIAAAAVMVLHSYCWAELDCDLLSRKALKALNAGTLGGHTTRHTDEGEVQPLRLQPPLPLYYPPAGKGERTLS